MRSFSSGVNSGCDALDPGACLCTCCPCTVCSISKSRSGESQEQLHALLHYQRARSAVWMDLHHLSKLPNMGGLPTVLQLWQAPCRPCAQQVLGACIATGKCTSACAAH